MKNFVHNKSTFFPFLFFFIGLITCRSDDSLPKFNWQQSGVIYDDINSFTTLRNNIFAGSISDIYVSSDVGHSWKPLHTTFGYTLSLASSSQYIFAGTWNGVYRSSDLGVTWVLPSPALDSAEITQVAYANEFLYGGGFGG